MLEAAATRVAAEKLSGHVRLVQASMDALPVSDRSMDLMIAHGIWNLARSGHEFRTALREAARVATPGAGLFLFTFSRHTLPSDAASVPGEPFVFTQFSGQPQCFLTASELLVELRGAGFSADEHMPLRELNNAQGLRQVASGPVIYEGSFRFTK